MTTAVLERPACRPAELTVAALEPEAEPRDRLACLADRVKAPEYPVRLRWMPNAVVFRDNRVTQHYAVLDDWPAERVVGRVAATGEEPY